MADINQVDFKHPEYLAYQSQVQMCRNVFNGVDSVTQYIYKLERESTLSIDTRKANATLKNYIKRATEAFVGMIFRKNIETTGIPDRLDAVLSKLDKYNNLDRFARDLSTSVIVDGKAYIAVDSPVDGMGDPYAVIYDRSSVINWKKNEDGEYSLFVIQEVVNVESGDFGMEQIDQWRVYRDDGTVTIYRNEKGNFYIEDVIETEFDYIPIVPVELSDIPPLYDIAKSTIKHTNRTSIKDKYLDMCATPVPIIWGADTTEDETGTKPVFVIGADEAFLFTGSKDECDFQWRELSGSSIDKLQEDLNVIEEDITSGIIRAATSDTTTIKTATQSFYEAAESSNRCVVIANSVEQGLNKMLEYLSDIGNIPLEEESRVIVNKDFNAISGNNQDLRLLWEVYLGGALSIETFLDSLSKFEVIDVGSVRDELLRIEKDTFKPKPKEAPEDTVAQQDNRTTSMQETQGEEDTTA